MKLIQICLGAALVIAAVSADAKNVRPRLLAAPSHDEVIKAYSADQLNEIANYLLARVENDPLKPGKKIIACDVTVDQANLWSGGELHSLVDEKEKERRANYEAEPAKFAANIKRCADSCSCGPYALMFEQISEPTVSNEAHKKNAEVLKAQLAKGSKEKTLACAKKAGWFCSSSLKKYLEGHG